MMTKILVDFQICISVPLSKGMPSNGYFSFLYKMLEKRLRNSFLLYLVVEILELVHEISSFLEVLYKRSVLKMKNFPKLTDKHKKQSSGCVLSKEKMFLKILQISQEKTYVWISFK